MILCSSSFRGVDLDFSLAEVHIEGASLDFHAIASFEDVA
jgi:hypothetical protein